jgi:hypothetical protein
MKIAESPPAYCSACHGQYPERQHVDFEAYWDGPVFETGPEDNTIKVAIDDLILCENCMDTAAMLLGYVKKKEIIKENYQLGKAVEAKNEKIKELEKIISDQSYTTEKILEQEVKRPVGRPQIRLPERSAA